jgi:hypothetical protein
LAPLLPWLSEFMIMDLVLGKNIFSSRAVCSATLAAFNSERPAAIPTASRLAAYSPVSIIFMRSHSKKNNYQVFVLIILHGRIQKQVAPFVVRVLEK